MTEQTRPRGFQARFVTAAAFAALAGFALNEGATLVKGNSALDTLGLVPLLLICVAVGGVAMLIRGSGALPGRGLLAAVFGLGMLTSGGLHGQLNLLPFAAAFTALMAC